VTVEIRKPKIGDTVGQYRIESKLGSGGMGDVFLCDDVSLGRRVAVKIMHAFDSSDTDLINRFVLEGKSLAKLTHPNIVSVFGLGEDNGFLYIAMEYVAGRSLYELSRDRSLTIREMIDIFADIAAGLDHAHAHGIVHRDIKPANILVDTNGRAKIIDFGIAKVIGGSPTGPEGIKTKTGAVIGTLNYIAPELFRGIAPSPSSDIYALGLLFAEMLTGRTPFKGESQFATMELIRDGNLEIPENLSAVLPESTWTTLKTIIHREPEERPNTATEAAKLLKAIPFPNLPSYFNSELVSVRIENVDELQQLLEDASVDPAEWQFIMALAVRTQASARAGDTGEDTTRLIERTGIAIPAEILKSSLESYRKDLDSILTLKRAEALSNLTPPIPPKQFTPHANSVDVVELNARPAVTGAVQPAPVAPPPVTKSGGGWIGLALVGAAIAAAVYFVPGIMKSGPPVATAPIRRNLGAGVEAPANAKVTAAPATRAGFAMVVEPSTDAWPPIERVAPEIGARQTWKWKIRSSQAGESTFVEQRTFEAVEDGLEKYKVERLRRNPSGDGVVADTAGEEWYLPSFAALPRKTLRSLVFGSVGGSAIGQPSAIFPLRKGKEVQFELSFKTTEPVGWQPLLNLSSGFAVDYRSACSIRDKLKLTLGGHEQELVKIDCYTKSDASEVSDVLYWSPEKSAVVRHDRRSSSTVHGTISEVSMSGELVDNVPNVLRNPAQTK
jgi:serine/threonine protein kinase